MTKINFNHVNKQRIFLFNFNQIFLWELVFYTSIRCFHRKYFKQKFRRGHFLENEIFLRRSKRRNIIERIVGEKFIWTIFLVFSFIIFFHLHFYLVKVQEILSWIKWAIKSLNRMVMIHFCLVESYYPNTVKNN